MLHLAGCWPGAKSLLMWKVVSAPPDHSKNRETVNLDHWHQTGPGSGGTGDIVRIPNVPNVAHNLPVGSRLSPFRNLGSLGGWTLGSTIVEGGIPMSISLYKNNPGNAWDFTSKVGHTSSRPCLSVCPQHLWSSSWYQRRWNWWPYTRI